MIIKGLEKTVGDFKLYIDELYLEPGKIHGLVGHNGAGKSILLKLMMGIMEPDAGSIDYEGLDIKEVTLMPQTPYLLHTSVYENIVFPLKLRGIQPDETEIDRLLEMAGLSEQKNQYALSLSSGEKQKLSFLRAVVFKPKLILMDETLSNLDPESEAAIIEMIKNTQADQKATWVIVSHQLENKKGLCDEIHHMSKGAMMD
ncbi:MAG: ATP-binding cassette domain-containing protein [Firmicutes bacterium]|nr:ATP-binding cassette domain-containing protein [Bacillota bacterium]